MGAAVPVHDREVIPTDRGGPPNPERIIHRGFGTSGRLLGALCGAPIRGISHHGETVTCAVCADLERQWDAGWRPA